MTTINTVDEQSGRGPGQGRFALFDNGFRPFFLLAGLWAIAGVVLWVGFLASGWFPQASPFAPLVWHGHELLFGFIGAAVAGFLLTAVPNWTGRPPLRGGPLMTLVTAWFLARGLALLGNGLNAWVLAFGDSLFLVMLVGLIGREVMIGRNSRNYAIVVLVGLLALANFFFHADALGFGMTVQDMARSVGIHLPLILIAVIGGRVCPAFTTNWMKQQGLTPLPIAFNRFDIMAIVVLIIAVGLHVALPGHLASSLALTGAGVLHLWRLFRWQGHRCLGEPIVFVLHLGYGWLAIGYLLLGLSGFGLGFGPTTALHALTAGAVGTMVLAIMTRAALGHSGREIKAAKAIVWAYGLVSLAACARIIASVLPYDPTVGYGLATLFWVLGFGIFMVVYVPILIWRPSA